MAVLISSYNQDADNLILPSLQSKNRYVLQIGSNFIMETKTRIETYSHAETLLEKLFQAPCESFVTELKKAADNYFQAANENDPKEEKEIRRNIEAIINQGMIVMMCCVCQYINIKTRNIFHRKMFNSFHR